MWTRETAWEDGKEFDFNAPENEEIWESIASYMNDEIREDVHGDLAPCTNKEFLDAYLKKDPEFVNLLDREFGIKWVED